MAALTPVVQAPDDDLKFSDGKNRVLGVALIDPATGDPYAAGGVSGGVTVNLGTDATAATQLAGGTSSRGWQSGIFLRLTQALARGGAFFQRLTDGTNDAVIAPANTAPTAADPALVVAVSQNSPINAQLQSIAGLQVPAHDHVTLAYTGTDLTSVVYRTGGAAGAVVGTVTLAYTSGVLTSVTRT